MLCETLLLQLKSVHFSPIAYTYSPQVSNRKSDCEMATASAPPYPNVLDQDDDVASLTTTDELPDLVSDEEDDDAWLHDMMILLGLDVWENDAQSAVTDSEANEGSEGLFGEWDDLEEFESDDDVWGIGVDAALDSFQAGGGDAHTGAVETRATGDGTSPDTPSTGLGLEGSLVSQLPATHDS